MLSSIHFLQVFHHRSPHLNLIVIDVFPQVNTSSDPFHDPLPNATAEERRKWTFEELHAQLLVLSSVPYIRWINRSPPAFSSSTR